MSESINITSIKQLSELDTIEPGGLNPSTKLLTIQSNKENKLLRYGYLDEDSTQTVSLVSLLATSLKLCNTPSDYTKLGSSASIILKILDLESQYNQHIETFNQILTLFESSISVINSRLDSIETNISNMSGSISFIENEITSIKNSRYTKEEVDNNISGSIYTSSANLSGFIYAKNQLLFNSISSTQTKITDTEKTISIMSNSITDNKNDITSLLTQLSSIMGDLQIVANSVDSQKYRISNIENKYNSILSGNLVYTTGTIINQGHTVNSGTINGPISGGTNIM